MERTKRIGFEIRTLSNLIRRNMNGSNAIKNADNVTGMHGYIIGYLYDHRDKDIFQKDLEEEFLIRRSTATVVLQLMEKNGLIVRQPVSYDARLKKLQLTQKAIEIHKSVVKDIDQVELRLRQGISDEELITFFSIMERLKKNIE